MVLIVEDKVLADRTVVDKTTAMGCVLGMSLPLLGGAILLREQARLLLTAALGPFVGLGLLADQ